ncbi:hypothetical protein [Hymenobacter negativus]|uniref:T9SS type A sorting domain-containing protein n=1 Tax=Hymenobacter negativus TaxID=2795026 RepID=A0ABS3QEV7_9BACT|nr:hypothetical protein [Hymenobacter negativus]MBO2009779.1 hypothetical protein [Hymenobacter negativus]
MFSRLRFLILLLFGLGLGFARQAQASHAQGGSLTYTSLGGNSYRVRVDFFRDCSGIAAPTSFTLNCTTACGAAGTTVVLNQVGAPFIGTPYNSTIQPTAVCPLTGSAPASAPANFAAFRYEGTVTLTPNQWILAAEESARPSVTNLSNSGTLRLEATLDNRGRVNNSVAYSNLPTFFVPYNQPNLLQIGAFDADGDSLSYALDRPLGGCNTYETYATYPTTSCQTGLDPLCSRRFINCTSPASNYSQSLPISVANDTVYENGSTTRPACPASGNLVTATIQPRFYFSALQGSFSFTPNRYLLTSSAYGDNKYVVVVKVTEWRRENGAYVAIGTTRRDMLWIVYDGGTAAIQPRLSPTVTVQNGSQTSSQALTAPIAVQAGEPISVTFSATTTGATPLAFTLEQNTVPGAVIQPGATPGTGRLTFTPPLSLPNGTYRVSVTVTDDAAPLRNIITVPVAFRVYRTALATYNAAASAQVSAYPTPFTEQVQFQLPTAGVQQLTVCDNLGRVVAHLTSQVDGKVQWAPGANVPAGLYSARSADGKLSIRLLRSAQ